MRKFSKTQKITIIALLTALQVVLTRFLGITTPIVSINFSFVPLVINAVLFGPISAAISSASADIIGSVLFPQGLGIYFPGYTLSAALNGLIYGYILYSKPKKLWRITLACAITGIFVSLLLGTYWVYVMTGQAYLLLLPTRIMKNLIMIPIKIVVIQILVYRVVELIKNNE